eukprot:g19589.t1
MGDGVWSDDIIDTVKQTGGGCFGRTRAVFANLDPEDNVYPKGPSIMFYKIFLDRGIARHFGGYDALAILEWDVVVAHPTSFDRLYKAAFFSAEPFWVKGSTLTGAEFHETAAVSEMWHILGHLNGNAIYNNKDQEFNDFVNYTLSRWGYKYPYDVALWATIADFPYSWPLWQRYSSKFVATQLMANVGFNDVNRETVGMAVARDTLFIHGDPARFGTACRQCYTDEEAALAEDRRLSLPGTTVPNPGVHVVMCATGNPPQASECSDECLATEDAVCDYRCGSGIYGDRNCNWRGLGSTCRFCFDDAFQAHLADEKAKLDGSRVILCATHEPPTAFSSDSAQESGYELQHVEGGGLTKSESSSLLSLEAVSEVPEVDILAPALTPFTGDITRGEVCAFMKGYFDFLPETRVSVSSVLYFMPGMQIGIATNPGDFHVFNRTLGQDASVTIVNSSHVEHAALVADKACGAGTRLILYLEVGEVLSRSFTEKDTHTTRGDLIVAFTNTEDSLAECNRRATGTSILLGFSSPCFTVGTDLILPVEVNERLRDVLRSNHVLNRARHHHNAEGAQRTTSGDERGDDELTESLASIAEIHREHATVYIPEVLAAIVFAGEFNSVVFNNPRQWSVQNLFAEASIWDIPLFYVPFFYNASDVILKSAKARAGLSDINTRLERAIPTASGRLRALDHSEGGPIVPFRMRTQLCRSARLEGLQLEGETQAQPRGVVK